MKKPKINWVRRSDNTHGYNANLDGRFVTILRAEAGRWLVFPCNSAGAALPLNVTSMGERSLQAAKGTAGHYLRTGWFYDIKVGARDVGSLS